MYNHSSSYSMQWQLIKNRSEVNQKASLPSSCSQKRSFRIKKTSSYSLDLVPLCVKSQQIFSDSSWLILSYIFVLPLYPVTALNCHCSDSFVQEAGGNFWQSGDCRPASWGRADGAWHSRHLSSPAVLGLLPSIFLSHTWNKMTNDRQEPKGSGSGMKRCWDRERLDQKHHFVFPCLIPEWEPEMRWHCFPVTLPFALYQLLLRLVSL